MGSVGERPDANNAGRVEDRVTIAEAATLLGVHPNTVRSRVKARMYRAEKVVTERGETWMIDRNSLPTNTPPSASQQIVNPQAMELVQELLRPFVNELGETREQLGAERTRRQRAEDRVQELEAELDALREPRESSETAMESGERAEQPSPAAGGAMADPIQQQRRHSRWGTLVLAALIVAAIAIIVVGWLTGFFSFLY
jgi:DNA-binding transcriptional regulator YhcF (GntR family)